MNRIQPVVCTAQREYRLYTFCLTGRQVLELCRVERFGETPDGVNRKLNEDHAYAIAEAMTHKTDLVWAEALLGDLRGSWMYDAEAGVLTYGDGSYITLDDGQHRHTALGLLNESELASLSFNITVTQDLPYTQRLKVFRMQGQRKPIDARLDLAQRNKLGDWRTDTDRDAYKLLLELNASPHSPLRGMLILDELVVRPYEGRHRPEGINGKGLFDTIKAVIGQRSPLNELSVAKRAEVVIHMIAAATVIWPKAWKSDKHVLTTARGINAVLSLIVKSPNFRGAVGKDFSQESIRNALSLAAAFDWAPSKHRNLGQSKIAERLDQAMVKGLRAASKQAAGA